MTWKVLQKIYVTGSFPRRGQWGVIYPEETRQKTPSSNAHFRQSPVILIDWLKSQAKRPVVPTPLRTLVQLKRSPVGLVSHCFYGAADKPPIISQQNSSFGWAQKTNVLYIASRPQRHRVLAEVSGHVLCEGQSALCIFFVGSIAELKVNSWSEATLRQLF